MFSGGTDARLPGIPHNHVWLRHRQVADAVIQFVLYCAGIVFYCSKAEWFEIVRDDADQVEWLYGALNDCPGNELGYTKGAEAGHNTQAAIFIAVSVMTDAAKTNQLSFQQSDCKLLHFQLAVVECKISDVLFDDREMFGCARMEFDGHGQIIWEPLRAVCSRAPQ